MHSELKRCIIHDWQPDLHQKKSHQKHLGWIHLFLEVWTNSLRTFLNKSEILIKMVLTATNIKVKLDRKWNIYVSHNKSHQMEILMLIFNECESHIKIIKMKKKLSRGFTIKKMFWNNVRCCKGKVQQKKNVKATK